MNLLRNIKRWSIHNAIRKGNVYNFKYLQNYSSAISDEYYSDSDDDDYDENKLHYIPKDFNKMRMSSKIQLKMAFNKLSGTFPPCFYCHSTGYVECRCCTDGCWKCRHTKLLECPICNGNGKGKLAKDILKNNRK